MQIHREKPDKHAISSYSENQVIIDGKSYDASLLVSRDTIITPWPIHSVSELTQAHLDPILELNPEIILFGVPSGENIPSEITAYLSQKRIGTEYMQLGAASRTFNILLSEQRRVVLALIFT